MNIASDLLAMLKRRPVTSTLAALVLSLLALMSFARYWITTESGRDFVTSQIDGREVAGYGRLSIRNLEGDPLSAFSVGSAEVRDASGVWLSVKSVTMTWSPLELLSRRVDLSDVSVQDVDVIRRPLRTATPPSSGKPWEVRLGDAKIERLHFAEGVAGLESSSAISARFLNARNGSIDASLQITPLDGAGDRIDALIKRDPSSAFDLQIDGIAPAGGLFAHLLKLPDGASAVLAASAAGDLKDGRGEARLTVDGSDKMFVSGKIEDNAMEASVRLDAALLPVSAKLKQFLGANAEAGLTATFEKKTVAFSVDSRLAAGAMKIAGTSRSDRFELLEPARLTARLTTLMPYWSGADGLDLDGTLAKSESGYQYAGDAALKVAERSSLPFDTASGQVMFTMGGGRLPFSGNVTVFKPLKSNTRFAGIVGETAELSGNGVYEFASRRVLIDAVEINHQSGSAQLLGEAGFADKTLNFSGKISQDINALPGGFGGTATGFVQAKGLLRDFELGLNLNLAGVTSNLETLNPLLEGRGTLRGLITITPSEGTIRRMDIRLPGAQALVSGRAYGKNGLDLKVSAEQAFALEIGGHEINLGSISAQVRRTFAGIRVTGTSEGGRAVVSGRTIEPLSAKADLLLDDGNVSGPITLTGLSDGHPAKVSFLLDRRGGTTYFKSIDGVIDAIKLSGSAALSDGGLLEADLDADASTLEFGGIRFGALKLSANSARTADNPFSVGATFEAADIEITSRLSIDQIRGSVTTTDKGYRFEGRLLDKKEDADSDVSFSGMIRSVGALPAGTLSLSGTLFGTPVATQKDIAWTLGPAPTADIDLAFLGGRVKARLHPGSEVTSSTVSLDALAIAPILNAFGLPEVDAVLSGTANGRLYGSNPEATFNFVSQSAVSGLTTALDMNLTGRLDRRALTFTAQAGYGPSLKSNAAGRLPVTTSPVGLVKLNRESAIDVRIDTSGDLEALRLVALAYGHDIGGQIESQVSVAGSLEKPDVSAEAAISGGNYEYGATGLSLKNVQIDSRYKNSVLTLVGSGNGLLGGAVSFDGRLAETETGVDVKFDRLLIYDHLGDQARISGDARLVEGDTDRVLSGALTINDARFNFDNASDNSSIRTLNIRWETDDPDAARQTILNKPIRFGLNVSATRGVIVRGRGLDSDWGVNLDVTGTPSNMLLNGRATLVRGSLELARRPFEFQTGQITFDGPLDTARLAVSATRDVDGFSVRAEVSGSPARPTIELSSTPSLPQDEILSRMLFGRSSIDLSALEAAELAASIARLAGRNTGFDTIGAIQSGLGVDRFRLGVDRAGNAELGVGQYVAPDVYLEVTTQGAAGNTVEVEWQPRPQVSVASEIGSTGESRVSVRWKKDY